MPGFQNMFSPLPNSNDPLGYTSPTNILSADAQINGQYLIDSLSFEYRHATGKMAIPNTAGTFDIVNLHQPVSLKIVHFEKVRLETPPDYPMADNGDANLVLLWENVQTCAPGVMTNMKSRIFAVRGVYVYAMIVPQRDGMAFPLGLLAIENRPTTTSQNPPPLPQLIMPASKAARMF